MDEKAQRYIDEQIEKRRNADQEKKIRILKDLGLGEYEAKPKGAKKKDYPDWREVDGKERYCRFVPIQMTDEEFEELMKYIPEGEKQDSQMNGWQGFAIVITIISALVMLIGIGSDSEAAAIIGGSIFGYMLLFMLPIISLLSKIEHNQHLK